jgi:hypothetical protein
MEHQSGLLAGTMMSSPFLHKNALFVLSVCKVKARIQKGPRHFCAVVKCTPANRRLDDGKEMKCQKNPARVWDIVKHE